MPSPPRAGQLRPTTRSPAASLAGSVDVDDLVRRRQQQLRVGAGRPRPASPCARRGPGRRGPRPRVASRWNGASFRSSSDVHRPAVAAVGVDVTRSRQSRRSRVRVEQRRRRRRRAPRAARARRRPRPSAAPRGRADRGVLLRAAVPAPSPTTASARSRGRPSRSRARPRGRRASSAARTRVEELALRAPRRRRTAGRCGCRRCPASPSTTPNRSRAAVLVAADDDDRARAHVLLLADDLRRRPRLR